MADERQKIYKPAVFKISGGAAGNQLIIGLRIKIGRNADLLEIAGADGFLSGLPGFSEAGIRTARRMLMIAITTSSSIRVKALIRFTISDSYR